MATLTDRRHLDDDSELARHEIQGGQERARDGRRLPLRLRLFGPPHAEPVGSNGAGGIALPPERRSQLVAWLALKRAWVGRRELAALLWPEHESKLAFANLRKALHRLQPAPWAAALEAQGQALRFPVATDVHAFEAALAEGRLDEALALGQGELLQGFDDPANEAWTGWLHFERERLRAAWRGAALARLAQDGHEPAAAEALAARLVATDPLDEAAVATQMRALARGGQLAGARAAYRAYADRVRQDLGLAPGAHLKALHDALANEAGTAALAVGSTGAAGSIDATGSIDAASSPGTAGALPGAGTPAATMDTDAGFVGRAAELQRIAELLAQDDCAVLCLVGPGGVGKTRLARRALQAMAPGFADGGAFVPLEDVASRAEIGAALAAALGLALGGKEPALDEVRQALVPRQMLLVLDNFEQLAADATWLDELVRAAPRLKLIVTSRVRPVAQAAWMLPVEGLPCPEAEDEDRLEAFDAARLFVRAALRVEPALVPAAEAAAIVDICRLVEGLPLALELAASFTRVLSCEAIAAELRQGTELLQAADPARPARQASMEAVFEQSWRLLADTERTALARLAVFRGGFSVAAARSVAGASLPVLAALVDKSLLRKDGARCHLHPLLQQFALQRLGDGAPLAAAASAHGRHFLRGLAESRGALELARREALRDTETEFENIRAAWRWTAVHGPTGDLVRAAPALMAFCDHLGRWAEGLGLLREALPAAGTAADADAGAARADGATGVGDETTASAPKAISDDVLAALGAAASHLEYRLDRYAEAEALAQRALAAARRCGDGTAQLQCTKVLAATCFRQARHAEARQWYRRTLKLAEAAADARNIAGTLGNLSLLERSAGHLDAALELSRQALQQHRAIADVAGEALCLNNQGMLLVSRMELDAAREALLAGRRLCEQHGLPTVRSMIEANLAEVADKQDDGPAMLAHARLALEISERCGQRATTVEARQLLMLAALRHGDLAAARAELAAAVGLALAIGRPVLAVNGAVMFARLLAAQGDRDVAAQVMAYALTHATVVGSERATGEALVREWGGRLRGPWRGPPLELLLRRIVLEAGQAFAPLVAELRRH